MALSQSDLREMTAGERLYPGFMYEHSRVDHEARYRFAKTYLKKTDIVLDAACGSGYGTAMLAEAAGKTFGIDISGHAIGFAQKNFQKTNTEFSVHDVVATGFPGSFFDYVVSFETFEHVSDQKSLLTEFKRILKPGGFLIVSTPDKDIHAKVDPGNKFHLRELTKEEFVAELSGYFEVRQLFGKNPYKKLKWWEVALRKIIKVANVIDVFKLRRILIPQSYKAGLVKHTEATIEQEKIYPMDVAGPNAVFDDLIAVCQKV